MSKECRHYRISGHVQGVCFRVSAQDKARELGLAGWVRNCPDGQVEAMAAGPYRNLEVFRQWLGEGPPGAAVDEVRTSVVDFNTLEDTLPIPFTIHRTPGAAV